MVVGTKVTLLSDRNAVETRPGVDKPLATGSERRKWQATCLPCTADKRKVSTIHVYLHSGLWQLVASPRARSTAMCEHTRQARAQPRYIKLKSQRNDKGLAET